MPRILSTEVRRLDGSASAMVVMSTPWKAWRGIMIGERVTLTARMTIATSAASAPGEVISRSVGNPVTSTAQEAELSMA